MSGFDAALVRERASESVCRADAYDVIAEVKEDLSAALDALASAEAALARIRALADEWEHTVYTLPPGYPMTVNQFAALWFKVPLRAALDGTP